MIKMYIVLQIKYLLFLSDFNENWMLWTPWLQNIQLTNFMNIRLVEAELFHTDRRADRHDEANSRFSQFCEHTWKGQSLSFSIKCYNHANLPPLVNISPWLTS
jgi:hypothetical protein